MFQSWLCARGWIMLLAVADLLELRAGETAYYIGRAVAGSGFRPFCDLCSKEAKYVDGSAQLGFPTPTRSRRSSPGERPKASPPTRSRGALLKPKELSTQSRELVQIFLQGIVSGG